MIIRRTTLLAGLTAAIPLAVAPTALASGAPAETSPETSSNSSSADARRSLVDVAQTASDETDQNYNTGSITVTPATVIQSDHGDVSFVVTGNGIAPRMRLTLDSVGLDAACSSSSLSGRAVRADYHGAFNTAVSASRCVPGTYTVEASQQSAPFQTLIGTVTVQAP